MTKLSTEQALTRAISHAQKGKINEAHDILENVLNEFSQNLFANLQRLKQVTSCDSSDVEAPSEKQLTHLINLYNSGLFSQAIEKAERLTKSYPNTPTVWNILGASAAQLDRMELAISAFRMVSNLEPEAADSYNNLGTALIESGNLDEGMIYLNKALKIKPNFPEAYFNIGNALSDQNLLEEAILSYRQALEFNPKYADAYCNLGHALKKQENYNDALEAYKCAVTLNPEHVQAIKNINDIKKLTGDA